MTHYLRTAPCMRNAIGELLQGKVVAPLVFAQRATQVRQHVQAALSDHSPPDANAHRVANK
jgi:hypothetical protein